MNKGRIILFVVGAAIIVTCVALAGKYLQKPTATVANNNYTPSVAVVTATPTSTPTSTSPSSTAISPGKATPSSTGAMKSFENGSYAFTYPSTWTIGSSMPTSLSNFGGSSWRGGSVPPGGAEINVATTTLYGSLGEMADYEFRSMTNVATNTIMISGLSCIEGQGQFVTNDGTPAQSEAVYCPRGHEVWKIYFSYRTGDPQAKSFESVFNGVLASFRFLP